MSSTIRESPNHFMVLDAISRGVKSVGKIASVTKLGKAEVEMIVNDLVTQRLVTKVEKMGFFGNMKEELAVTETGVRLLASKKRELEQKFQQLQQYYSGGQTQQLRNAMQADRMWLPFMIFSGIMNALFFMSMMSLLGAALTPGEGAFAGDQGAGGAMDDGGAGDFGGDFSF